LLVYLFLAWFGHDACIAAILRTLRYSTITHSLTNHIGGVMVSVLASSAWGWIH
jgi:hypothetical protein